MRTIVHNYKSKKMWTIVHNYKSKKDVDNCPQRQIKKGLDKRHGQMSTPPARPTDPGITSAAPGHKPHSHILTWLADRFHVALGALSIIPCHVAHKLLNQGPINFPLLMSCRARHAHGVTISGANGRHKPKRQRRPAVCTHGHPFYKEPHGHRHGRGASRSTRPV